MIFPIVVVLASATFSIFLDQTQDISNLYRISLYVEAAKGIISNPTFGHGLGSFNTDIFGVTFDYPHNFLLEFAYEVGVVSTALFMFRAVHVLNRSNTAIQTIFIFGILNASFSGDLFNNYVVFITYFLAENLKSQKIATEEF